MKIKEIQDSIIPKLFAFCGVPIIEGDGVGERPAGPHATFKFTTMYGKDVGQSEEIGSMAADRYTLTMRESFRVTISFTAYDMDDNKSRDLAQQIYDWFKFYGDDALNAANIVVIEQTGITNRDAFIVENYERRNGFDVIIRVSRELTRQAGFIESVEGLK